MIQRPRLMLIDDDNDFRRMLMVTLRRHFFVVEAVDGCEGYSRALVTPLDVVLLDVRMEGWDGIETLRRFRENSKLTRLPVLMLTSENRRGAVDDAIKFGANDYILKSGLNHAVLVARIIQSLPEHLVN